MNRLLAILIIVFCIFAALPTMAQTIRIDCGGPGFSGGSLVFQPDRPYVTGNAGFVGGQPDSSGRVSSRVEGSPLRLLFVSQRRGMQAYRFDLPAGTYALELHFAETRLHGPNQRIFSIRAEGVELLPDLDIFAFVEKDYAVFYRFPVTVTDGTLDVEFFPLTGESLIAGIGVERTTVDAIAPPPPPFFEVRGSYNRNILVWNPVNLPDVVGYNIERSSSPSGPSELLTPTPHPLARFFDDDVTKGDTWYYRLKTVDLWGNQSTETAMISATVLDDDSSALPLFKIDVDEFDLAILQADPFADDYVPATFSHRDITHPDIGVRFRGNVTRNQNKKSWKINFPGSAPFIGLDKLNLNAESNDTTMLKEKICYDFIEGLNVHAPSASFARVEVNGEYRGIFSRVENVDLEFIDRRGLNTKGNLYKADSFDCGFEILPSEDDYRRAWDKKTNEGEGYDDLIGLIETINSTPDDEFLLTIARMFDLDSLLDYYAAIVLTANFDHVFHNYYVYHDLDRDIWELLPKDWNGTFGQVDFAVDYGTVNSPGGPGAGDASNVLMTRVLDVPELRLRYANKLIELLDANFSPTTLESRIDDNFAEIESDAILDVYKIGRERIEVFLSGPDQLKNFIGDRVAWLRPEAENYRPEITQELFINELNAVDDWIEIYNNGESSIDLSYYSLTDDLGSPRKWIFPTATMIEPGAYLLVDNAIALSQNGETIGLFGPDADGTPLLDFITYNPLEVRISFGRRHDGSALWTEQPQPTPGQPNIGPGATPPIIWGVNVSSVDANQDMIITAVIEGESAIIEATLNLDTGSGWTSQPMLDDGFHGDETAGDTLYGVMVPGFAPGTVVRFYIAASTVDGLTATNPLKGADDPLTLTIPSEAGDLIINELQADNESTIVDDLGEYDDWIEIFNRGSEPIDLSALHLSDDPTNPQKWTFPEGTIIEAGEYLIIWADDDQDQGHLHTNFKLSKDGEELILYDGNSNNVLDSVEFPMQNPDESWIRNGDESWSATSSPTPGRPNVAAPRRAGGRFGESP